MESPGSNGCTLSSTIFFMFNIAFPQRHHHAKKLTIHQHHQHHQHHQQLRS